MNRWPALTLYATAMVLFSSLQDVRLLAAGLLAWALVAGPASLRLLRRTLLAAGGFCAVASAGVILAGALGDGIDTRWLAVANLRATLLTACTLLAVERIAWSRTFARWPTAVTLGVVVQSQIRILRRMFEDLQLGLKSRSPRRPRLRTTLSHRASAGSFLLGRALAQADEIGLALRARGVGHARRR